MLLRPPFLDLDLLTTQLAAVTNYVGMTLNGDDEVREFGRIAIAKLQESPQVFKLGGPCLTFNRMELRSRLTAKKVFERDLDGDASQFSLKLIRQFENRFNGALMRLHNIDDQAVLLVTTIINEVAIYQEPRPEAGTITSEIGLIYCNAQPHWNEVDWLRIIFHETAHTLLNIVDMVVGLMPDPDLLDATENSC